MEDLDPPREVPGAADAILRALERLGFEWDGPVLYQSTRTEAYRAAIAQLDAQGHLYRCTCSRRDLRKLGAGPIYPGTCRAGDQSNDRPAALRVLTTAAQVSFHDRLRGPFEQRLARDVGDFVLLRRDGLFAYHLAVVVDDAEQHVTEVVRGSDLLDCTPRQIFLQGLLGLPTPVYAHLPTVLASDGQKLSKQTGARPIDAWPPGEALCAALRFLRQAPPPDLATAPTELIWRWAVQHWQLEALGDARNLAFDPGL